MWPSVARIKQIILSLLSLFRRCCSDKDTKQQNDTFEHHWGTEFVWRFDELPTQGTLPNYRVPYSGDIYLDTAGGTVKALAPAFTPRKRRVQPALSKAPFGGAPQQRFRLLAVGFEAGRFTLPPGRVGRDSGRGGAVVLHRIKSNITLAKSALSVPEGPTLPEGE